MQNIFRSLANTLQKNKSHNITLAVALFVAVISYVLLLKTDPKPILEEKLLQEAKSTASPTKKPEESALIAIDIAGAVNKPGVYTLPIGSRLIDALKLANGLSLTADKTYFYQQFNQAGVLVDQQKIYIPAISEDSIIPAYLDGDAPKPGSQIAKEISINTASQSELDSLPGLGPVTVLKIIDNRPYASIQELVDKKVLSQTLFNKVKDKIIE